MKVTGKERVARLGAKAVREAVAIKIDGKVLDLMTPVEDDAEIEVVTLRSPEGLDVLRHSASHVMADAVMQLFPGTSLGYGPAIEDGFYYDFGLPGETTFRPEDLPRIEEKMREIIAADLPFDRQVVARDDAARILREAGQDLKVQTVEELPPEEDVTFYRHGGFADLCRGPHLPSTGRIPSFKLLSIAGAYWKGDERNPMLQRIYGTAFPGKKELAEFVRLRAEAEKRDHRRLGKDLGLFIFFEEGPGFPCWRPRGVTLINAVLEYWRDLHRRAGYVEIRTPLILNESLWRRSGHWDNYRENMYFTEIDE
ncbi:MAG: threonine--tRNA ligase, partial [Planctomycetes bacterium]|nr:threonine--tRNA ligase [Planctomycetota bacterium]